MKIDQVPSTPKGLHKTVRPTCSTLSGLARRLLSTAPQGGAALTLGCVVRPLRGEPATYSVQAGGSGWPFAGFGLPAAGGGNFGLFVSAVSWTRGAACV